MCRGEALTQGWKFIEFNHRTHETEREEINIVERVEDNETWGSRITKQEEESSPQSSRCVDGADHMQRNYQISWPGKKKNEEKKAFRRHDFKSRGDSAFMIN